MRIALVHPHRVTREMLIRAIAAKVEAEVVEFGSLEDLFVSSMNYDVFVLYNIFGREKLDRHEGVKWIRGMKPQALVLSMVHYKYFDRKYMPPGADAILMRVGDEIRQVTQLIQTGVQGKSYFLVSGHMSEPEKM